MDIDLSTLPDEIINQIVMFSIPTYPYHKEFKNIFKWYDMDDSNASIFDCVRLLTPWEGDFLTYRYCHFQRIYDEEL
jgi:hypothetical protein